MPFRDERWLIGTLYLIRRIGMDDLLDLADARGLVNRLTDLIAEKTPEADEEIIIFAMPDQLQEHLDETRPPGRARGVF
jgi:hypothetical protein